MAFSFHIYPNLHLTVFRPIGVLTATDVLSYITQVRDDPAYDPNNNRLIENTFLIDVDISYANMCNIQANEGIAARQTTRQVRTAFINDGDSNFGMARMYQSIAQGRGQQTVALCDTRDQALNFLQVDLQAYAREIRSSLH